MGQLHSITLLQRSHQNHCSYVRTEANLVWFSCQPKNYLGLCESTLKNHNSIIQLGDRARATLAGSMRTFCRVSTKNRRADFLSGSDGELVLVLMSDLQSV